MKKKQMKKEKSIPVAIACGVGVSILMTFLITAVMALLVSGEQLPEKTVGYGSLICLLLSSMTGAWISCKMAGQKVLIVAAISGAAYFVFLLCCTAMFFGGEYQAVGQTVLMILGGSLAAGLLQISGYAKGKRRRKSYGFR